MIALEVAENVKEIQNLHSSVESSNADVDTAMKLANDLLSTGKSDVNQIKLNFELATLSNASWQSAERTGALALMSYDEVRRYSELYAFQQLFDTQQRKAIDLVASSSALIARSFDPTTAKPQDLARFREQLMVLQANLQVTEQLGTQLLDAYRKFQSNK